jgi:urease accessory protein
MTQALSAAESSPRARGWSARLALGFAHISGRTLLESRAHAGPLLVQRPFYPEPDGVCHVYILHPPGGVVGGDLLDVQIDAKSGASAVITTPAATKFYRSAQRLARQSTRIRIAPDASVEWLPQEAIVFDGACAESLVSVELEPGGNFLGWEIVCLGRPAAALPFTRGHFRQRFELWQGARPLCIERASFAGSTELQQRSAGLAGCSTFGTLVCATREPRAVRAVREALSQDSAFSVSGLRDVLVCRYLGGSTEQARRGLLAAWSALRPLVLGRAPSPPRIWST